jgi:Type II CAAX prenyl endopeptidase Rce1-like
MLLLPQPSIFTWVRRHGKGALPQAELAAAAENRAWYFFQISIVVCVLCLWARYHPSLLAQLSLGTKNAVRCSTAGIVAGSLLLLARFAYVSHPRHRTSRLTEHPFTRGSVRTWFLIFVAVGALEEIWRASCILSLQVNDSSSTTAIAVTSIAFVFAHMSGVPGRIVGIQEEALWELLFGLALGILFIAFGNLITPYVAGLEFNIGNFYLMRGKTRAYSTSSSSTLQ